MNDVIRIGFWGMVSVSALRSTQFAVVFSEILLINLSHWRKSTRHVLPLRMLDIVHFVSRCHHHDACQVSKAHENNRKLNSCVIETFFQLNVLLSRLEEIGVHLITLIDFKVLHT